MPFTFLIIVKWTNPASLCECDNRDTSKVVLGSRVFLSYLYATLYLSKTLAISSQEVANFISATKASALIFDASSAVFPIAIPYCSSKSELLPSLRFVIFNSSASFLLAKSSFS